MSSESAQLTCFVLMPFSKAFGFVYEYGIRRALDDLGRDATRTTPMEVIVSRADESLAINVNKVYDVIESIRRSDLIVIDISGDNPNVLWELGYCQALGKHIVPIRQSTDGMPFNIRGLDVIQYEFSVEGMERLKKAFVEKLRGLVESIALYRSSLRFEPQITYLMTDIQDRLSRIRSDSILRSLARNEIIRLRRRIKSLTEGKFDLRNEKPNEEIIAYYCDYLSQLDSEDCGFDTVTFFSFWNEITDQGKIWDYLNANIHAAEKGVRIRRVFIVDQSVPLTSSETELLTRLLAKLREDSGDYRDRIELRLLRSRSFKDDLQQYGNFGILQRGPERLLFKPAYTEDGRMRETQFLYCDERHPGTPEFKHHETELKKHETLFRTVWSKSQPVSDAANE